MFYVYFFIFILVDNKINSISESFNERINRINIDKKN